MGGYSFLPENPEDYYYGNDWSDPIGLQAFQLEEQKRRQRELFAKTPIEHGDWGSFFGHFADELEKNPDLSMPLGVPKKGFDYLTGLFTGDTKLNAQGDVDYKPLQETQPVVDWTNSFAKTLSTPMGETYDKPEIRNSIPVDLSKPPDLPEQKLVSSGLRSGLGFLTDPSTPLIRNPLVGMGMTIPMLKDIPEKAGRIWSEFDRGEGLTDKGAEELGSFIPEAAMLGLGLKHQVPQASKFLGGLVPELKFGDSGYSTRSNLRFQDPGLESPGLPNFVSAMAEGSGPKFDAPDPLIQQLDYLKSLGVLTGNRSGISQPKTMSLWHGTGNRNWRLDPSQPLPLPEQESYTGLEKPQYPRVVDRPFEPFSSRHASDRNLHGGPFYFGETPGFVEGQYAVAHEGSGIDPAIINADVTVNKGWDLEGPVPRDIRLKALTKAQQAINNTRETGQPGVEKRLKYYRDLYQDLKDPNINSRDFHDRFGDLMEHIADERGDFTNPEDFVASHGGEKTSLPLWDRPNKNQFDLVNKLIMDELGYDALTHQSKNFDEQITIPFTRHQIKTRDVIPVGKLSERSSQDLINQLASLDQSKESNQPLIDELYTEISGRKAAARFLPDEAFIDPETYRVKLFDEINSIPRHLREEANNIGLIDQLHYLDLAQKKGLTLEDVAALREGKPPGKKQAPELTPGEFELLPEPLKQEAIKTGQFKGQSLKNPSVRIRENKPLQPGEEYLDLGSIINESLPVETPGPKDINIPSVAKSVAEKLGYKPDPFAGTRSNIQESGSTPLSRFEASQEKKYGRDWRDKQPDAEKVFHEKLLKGEGKFIPVASEAAKGEAPSGPDAETGNSRVLTRSAKNKDGSTTKYYEELASDPEAPPVLYKERYDATGQLIRNEVSTDDGATWKPVENVDEAAQPSDFETPKTESLPVGTEAPKSEFVPMTAEEKTKAGIPRPQKTKPLTGEELKAQREKDQAQRDASWEDHQRQLAEIADLKDRLKVANQMAVGGDREAGKRAKAIEQELRDKLRVEREWKAQQDREKKAETVKPQAEATKEDRARELAHKKELQNQLRIERQKVDAGDREAKQRVKALEAEIRDILKVEGQYQKAQEKQSWTVTLDNGATVNIKARTKEAAQKYVEEKAKLNGAVAKVVGVSPKATPLEKALARKAPDAKSSFLDNPVVQLFNSAKSLAFGGDVGHLLRQGKQLNANLLFSRKAPEVLKQFSTLAKSIKSEKFFDDFHKKLNEDPTIRMLTDKFGLDMPGVGKGHLKEEVFHGAGLVEKAPLIGKYYAKPSERAYTAGLNFLRAANAKMLVENLQKRGFTPDNAPERYRGVARAINIISQRGDFSGKTAKILSDASAVFGAPRAKAARIQNLKALVEGGESGKIARETFAKTVGMNIIMYGLIKAAYPNAQFITDKDRTDFGKIKIGNTTWDPWMGLGTTVRTVMRVTGGKATSPYSGKSYGTAPIDAPTKEVTNMLAPGIRAAWTLIMGNDPASWAIGKPPGGYLKDRRESISDVLPLSPKQAYEIMSENGPEGLLLAAMQMGGEGVDVFNPEKAKAEQTRLKQERGIPLKSTKKKRTYTF